jgi:hypothetical protein
MNLDIFMWIREAMNSEIARMSEWKGSKYPGNS